MNLIPIFVGALLIAVFVSPFNLEWWQTVALTALWGIHIAENQTKWKN